MAHATYRMTCFAYLLIGTVPTGMSIQVQMVSNGTTQSEPFIYPVALPRDSATALGRAPAGGDGEGDGEGCN